MCNQNIQNGIFRILWFCFIDSYWQWTEEVITCIAITPSKLHKKWTREGLRFSDFGGGKVTYFGAFL